MKNVLFQPDFARVQDDKTLIRDTSNNAILAASIEEKRKYVEAQQKELNKRKAEKEAVDRMEKDRTRSRHDQNPSDDAPK
jgi:hypothetical protein